MAAFWLTWLGLLLSFTGSSLTRFGLSVWVFEQTRNPEAYSTLLFFATVPLALGSLIAGPLVDRWNRQQVLLIANIVASVPTLAIMVLFFTDRLAVWQLYVALFVNGAANAFILPAFDASIRMLVPKEQLGRASGLSQMIQSLGTIIAPPLAGLLLVHLGLGSVFIVDFLTMSAAVLALTAVIIPQPDTAGTITKSVWQDFVFGLRYIAERPPFVFLMAFLTLVIFAQSFVYALSGPLVLGFGDEADLGLVYGAFGVGGLIGAILVGVTDGTRRRMHGILLGTLGMAVGAVIAGLRPDTLWVGGGVFVFGLAMMFMIALNRAIYQEKAAPDVLGRIFAFRVAIGVGAQAVGLLLASWLAANLFEPALRAGGGLAERLGPLLGVGEGRGAAALTLLTGIVLMGTTLIAALTPALRKLEDRLPDYEAPKPPDPALDGVQRPAPGDAFAGGESAQGD
jgi:MFS family permease